MRSFISITIWLSGISEFLIFLPQAKKEHFFNVYIMPKLSKIRKKRNIQAYKYTSGIYMGMYVIHPHGVNLCTKLKSIPQLGP